MAGQTASERKDLSTLLGGHLRENGMLMALVAIVAFFTIVLQLRDQPVNFLQPQIITNVFLQNGHIIVLALGMLLVIVAGHIDLSVGSVAAFTGAIAAWLTVQQGLPYYVVIPLTLIVGGIIGAMQGYWIAFWRIPSFIVTLAGMMVFRGATMWMLGGQNIGPFPREFQAMSNGFIPDLLGIGRPHGLTLLVIAVAILAVFLFGLRGRAREKQFSVVQEPMAFFVGRNVLIALALAFVGYQLSSFRGLPNVLVVVTLLTVLYAFLTENTSLGRRIYAVGGNEKAAKLSGIKTERLVFFCFVNMGVLAALAGMMVTARLNSATPKAGTGFELVAIASVFIGGASMTGGSGKIMGVVIGALFMGVMNMGMSIMSIGIDYQQMIIGLVLLAAVIFDVYSKNK
ncbi:Xylose transport system permease protein xylH [Pannonibacter phragmitetus]|uniref:Xylose transport system permease protein XylH n=1 Tax=Pannonibacter phragmitetus TaxID=121719 RepID=A0A378ZY76_9HYPH|nr:multiple monosaccharide ABC transporter permease [Pannonibacter phragmitetus]SUB02186.1 Xylose transport system permease protein xylH [Pannonibacter phragmitetus]